MLSVVIPTLQKDLNILNKLVEILNRDVCVGEIIIIDNSRKGFVTTGEKCRIIIPDENEYVNPSWNMGVRKAKYEYVALFNDDLLIPENFCSEVHKHLSKEIGIVGINKSDIHNMLLGEADTLPATSEIHLEPVSEIFEYFGIIMFFHKDNYIPIPYEMKIWCGDDYLFEMNNRRGRKNYKVCGQLIKHASSMSSSSSRFDRIKKEDIKVYAQYNKKFNEHSFMKKHTFLQRLFSLRNEGPYKVLCLLGIRMRFKRVASAN